MSTQREEEVELGNQIMHQLDHPAALEKLYRQNKSSFAKAFHRLFPEVHDHLIAQVWHERLSRSEDEIDWGKKNDWLYLGFCILIAGFIAKLPALLNKEADIFYTRNIGFILFPALAAYFFRKQQMTLRKALFPVLAICISAVYINILPMQERSDTILLACVHLPICLWAIIGFSFPASSSSGYEKRIAFLRYNGDLVVICAIMVIAGIVFTGITIGLFKMIGLRIENFVSNYVVIWGAPAIPIIGSFLVQNNAALVSKISPVIARIFTPVVLVTLTCFLIAMGYTGKDPYTDREFLLFFNLILIGVMALILFSVSEAARQNNSKWQLYILCGLSFVTIINNGIALSAVTFRIVEFGLTPNRLAVLSGNILIFVNLAMIGYHLFRIIREKSTIQRVEKVFATFLPVYGSWAALVAFLLPILFKFN